MPTQPGIIELSAPAGPANDAPQMSVTTSPRSLIYVPGLAFPGGDPVSGNRYNDAAAPSIGPGKTGLDLLMAICQQITTGGGEVVVEFDFSHAANTQTWNALALNFGTGNVTFQGIKGLSSNPPPTLTIQESTMVVPARLTVRDMEIIVNSAASDFLTSSGTSKPYIEFYGRSIINTTNTKAFLHCTGPGTNTPRVRFADDCSEVGGNDLFVCSGGATGTAFIQDFANIDGVAFSGTWQINRVAIPQSFTFRPGGATVAPVYGDWGTLTGALLAATPGIKVVSIDMSLNGGDTFVLPAGAYNFGPDVQFVGLLNPATEVYPQLIASAGTTWTQSPTMVTNVSILVNQAQDLCTDTTETHVTINGSGDLSASGAGAVFHRTVAAALSLTLAAQATTGASGGNPVVSVAGAGNASVVALDTAAIGAGTLSGSASISIVVASDAVSLGVPAGGTTVSVLPGVQWTARGSTGLDPNGVFHGFVGSKFSDASNHVWVATGIGTAWTGVLPSVTLQPSGADTEGVFTSWAEVHSYLRGQGGQKSLTIDLSATGGTFSPPAGAADFGPNVSLIGYESPTTDRPTLTVNAGTTWTTPPVSVQNMTIQVNQGVDLITRSAGQSDACDITDCDIANVSHAFWNVSGGASVAFSLRGYTNVTGTGTLVSSGTGGMPITFYDQALLAAGAFVDGGNTDQVIFTSPSNQVDRSYGPIASAAGQGVTIAFQLAGDDPNVAAINVVSGSMLLDTNTDRLWVANFAGSAWTGTTPDVTYKPGGADSGTVFLSWATVHAYLREQGVAKTFTVDLSASAGTNAPPAGAFDFGPQVTVIGAIDPATHAQPILQFTAGTTWTSLPVRIHDLSIQSNQGSGPVCTGPQTGQMFLTGRTAIAATTTFLDATGAGGTFDILARDECSVQGLALVSAITKGAGTATVHAFDRASMSTRAVDTTIQVRIESPDVSVASTVLFAVFVPAGMRWTMVSIPNTVISGDPGAEVVDVNGHVWTNVDGGTTWAGLYPDVVFNPNAANSSPRVFNDADWSQLEPYLFSIAGAKRIQCDFSGSADSFTAPAGAFDFGADVEWNGIVDPASGGNFTTIVFSAGTTFTTPPERMSGLMQFSVTQAGAVVTDPGTAFGGLAFLRLFEYAAIQSGPAAGPFIDATAGSITIFLKDQSSLAGAGAITVAASGGGFAAAIVEDMATVAPGAMTNNASFTNITLESGAGIVDHSYVTITFVESGVTWSAAIANPNTAHVNPGAPGAAFVNTGGGVGTTAWFNRNGTTTGWFNVA